MGVGAHEGVEGDGVAVLVGVEAPVAELERGEEAVLGTGVQRLAPDDEPGADGGACGPDQARELDDRRALPGLTVLADGRCQNSSIPMASRMAAVTWAFERHGTKKPTLRCPAGRQGSPRCSPAESARTMTWRRTRPASSPRWWPRAISAGSWAIGLVEDADVVGDGVGPGVARAEHPRERLAGRVGETEQRVEPEPALVGRGGSILALGVDLDKGGVDVEEDRARCRSWPTSACQTSARTWARASAMPERVVGVDLVEGAQHRRVRGDEPEQVLASAQVLDVRAALAAAGQHQGHLDEDLAPVVQRERSPRKGIAAESESPRPNRSAKEQRACRPTWATTPVPPGSTTTRLALVASTSEVPSWLGYLLPRQQQFPLLRRAFPRTRAGQLMRPRE